MTAMRERVQQLAGKYQDEVSRIRKHLHRHPELSFQEFKTAQYIAETLQAMQIEVRYMAQTGLVAYIRGQNPDKRIVALRADIDALPIHEVNDVPYKSQTAGVMHACGHDVHTASLIGTLKILHELKDAWEGTVRLIFQPGEEQLPGGASQMIQEGVLENPQPHIILGQHVAPQLPVGEIGIASGFNSANTDEVRITLQGTSGHAAFPHRTVDTILMAAHTVVALQQIVSRNMSPTTSSLLSICQIQGGHTTNVIPGEVHLSGTLRTQGEYERRLAYQRIKEIGHGIAQSMGGNCEVNITRGYPAVYNQDLLTSRVREAAETYLGHAQVKPWSTAMIGEDFGFYTEKIPGCFYFLGTSNAKDKKPSDIHTATFDVDEEVFSVGPGLMAWLTLCTLAQDQEVK